MAMVLGFPWGKLSAKQTDEGNLSVGRAFPVPPVPLIRQPFGLPPSPKGKAKRLGCVKPMSAAERHERDHGSHRRSRAFPPSFGQ